MPIAANRKTMAAMKCCRWLSSMCGVNGLGALGLMASVGQTCDYGFVSACLVAYLDENLALFGEKFVVARSELDKPVVFVQVTRMVWRGVCYDAPCERTGYLPYHYEMVVFALYND